MKHPYIVLTIDGDTWTVHVCRDLAAALDVKARCGGTVYEPLGLSESRAVRRECAGLPEVKEF